MLSVDNVKEIASSWSISFLEPGSKKETYLQKWRKLRDNAKRVDMSQIYIQGRSDCFSDFVSGTERA